jgi:hypothetical protein
VHHMHAMWCNNYWKLAPVIAHGKYPLPTGMRTVVAWTDRVPDRDGIKSVVNDVCFRPDGSQVRGPATSLSLATLPSSFSHVPPPAPPLMTLRA